MIDVLDVVVIVVVAACVCFALLEVFFENATQEWLTEPIKIVD